MLINFWYPAARSDELTDQPFKRRMLGQDFVLFRDSQGVARCLSNTCVHRGGSLAGGKVKGDCVECPYHGWQFDGDGHCHRIPSLGPDAKIPGRTRVDAYPVDERYGLVFAFLGDLPEAERPPLMEIPEYGADGPQEGWAATIQYFEWGIDYMRSIENGLDPAHNEFVHPTHGFSYEFEEQYRVRELDVVGDDWGTGFWTDYFAPPLAEEKMKQASGRSENATVRIGTGHSGPANLWTYINPTPEMHIYQYAFETPIDADRTSIYLVNLRNFLVEPEHDQRMMDRNQYVAHQDRDVLGELRPVLTPPTNQHELFMPADKVIGMYREKIKRWEQRGWRIDFDKVEANRRKVAYAIPSPARREVKGWVLDAVPLVAGAAESAAAAKAVSG
jgi:phenylpropionate dioxygenase-like ring-hydroxylating dioxygenase large terminal subunit